jgi:hypothetical protein
MSAADRVISWSTAVAVIGVAAVAAVVSYEHAGDLIRAHGEAGWTARLPSARPGYLSSVLPTAPSPARYDEIVSAQPVELEDPLDPQRILDQLPADERGFFLDQYREAVDNARDPAGWKQLRRILRLWRFHADAARDPGYREALDRARGPVSGGMPLEEAVGVYRPAL